MGNEGQVVLAYLCEDHDSDRESPPSRPDEPVDAEERIALVTFRDCLEHRFGGPNDEAFSGHPLAARGLHPYAAFEIESSSWVRSLERMNSVHPNRSSRMFHGVRHVVFAFHDSVFECCCRSFEVRRLRGSIASITHEMLATFEWDAG